jgi:hypothetical protein
LQDFLLQSDYHHLTLAKMEIVWTLHAEERQRQWEQRLSITRQEVETVLRDPEQVVPDDEGVLVTQSRRGNGLLRVAFVQIGSTQRILTLYWTNQVSRYWQETPDETAI